MYQKWQSYDVWFQRYQLQGQNFLSFWTIFCTFTPLKTQKIKILKLGHFSPFYPCKNPKNQNFGKMKKTPEDIILYKSTKNHDHMLHCSWDTMCDRSNSYFLFWVIFCCFTPLMTPKIKILKQWKYSLEISSFYTCVPKIMTTWYKVPEIWCATDGWPAGKSDI